MDKTNKQSGDVILYDGRVVVYKMEGDVMLYVVGGGEENEILLFGVVLALRDSLAILLKSVPVLHPHFISFPPSPDFFFKKILRLSPLFSLPFLVSFPLPNKKSETLPR